MTRNSKGQQVLADTTSIDQETMCMGKRGPRRRDGNREPGGRLSRRAEHVAARLRDGLDREERDVISTGIEARQRVHDVPARHARDQLAGTFIGRLCLSGEMTRIQYDAAQSWLEARARYLRAIGAAPEPGAVDLNAVHGRPVGEERTAADRQAIALYREAAKAVQEAQNVLGLRANLFGALNYVVERDVFANNLVADARLALNALARHYGLDRDRRAA